MKLIGVTGKSGAGKTTFSDILAEKTNIGVIHIDDILTQIKLKYFRIFMNKNKDGEKVKVNSKLKTFIYRNRLIFNTFMKLRAKLIEKNLESEIQDLQNAGKDYVIIDDIFIKYLKVYNDLSRIFLIERPYEVRREALKERDDLTKEEIVAYDTAHHKGSYKEISERGNVLKITNNGTQENLREKANEIYTQYFMPFKERCKEKTNNTTICEEKSKDKVSIRKREESEINIK